MNRDLIRVAIPLAILLAPAVAAAPLAIVGDGRFTYDWSLPGASGECWESATVHIAAQYVNDRLHVWLASDTRSVMDIAWRAPWDPVNAECPMILEYGGGVVVNPCQTFDTSVPSPASVAADPYFYPTSHLSQWFAKQVSFPDGGRANYLIYVGDYNDLGPTIGNWIPPTGGGPVGNFDLRFFGECWAPSGAHAVWSLYTDRAGASVYELT